MNMKNSKRPASARRKIAAPGTRPNFKRILATTDFSDHSLPGVRYALWLGGKMGASLDFLHVVEPASLLAGMESVVLVRPDLEVAALARRQLEALAERETEGDSKVAAVVRTGKPFHEIALAARERAADLIVIATHGHTGLKCGWLGRTAERVVRHAHGPVLAVRELNRKTL